MTLALRLYAECVSEAEARALLAGLLGALAAYRPRAAAAPARYWKIPEWFGFEVDLEDASQASFDAVVALAAGGWHHGGDAHDRSSVWNHSEGSAFLVPQVRWAEVQLSGAAP